jgi:hypothetical protein
MRAIKTENTPENLGPPPGTPEGEILDLPFRWDNQYGYKEVVSVWRLTEAERDAIANGCNVELGVGWIGAFPPVRLGVTHEGMDR